LTVCRQNAKTRFFSKTKQKLSSEIIIIIIIINLLAQKHDKVTCATKQIERDSKDTDPTNSCPRKVQIKLFRKSLQK